MAEGSGLVDLERELTCSICTDLLYQPLTLLDCLHTFCGACLKEWFAFQASTATSLHPYTCPSCRAAVRTTQRNAQVTTLVEMFLKAHPDKGKSEDEKAMDREKYTPGDHVMPKLRRRGHDDEEDTRIMEEVQQLSLRELGIDSGQESGRESGRGSRRRALEVPSESGRRGRRSRSGEERRRDASRSSRRSAREAERRERRRDSPEPSTTSPTEAVPPRHLDHQSSLRSLLSASDFDSQEMEEEIMRQIMEEGLLDGIDLNNIDVAQEDEISERIAQAYRRRQNERQRERRERRERLAREGRTESSPGTPGTPQETRSPAQREEQSRRRTHARSESGIPVLASMITHTGQSSSRPPVSRPSLIEAANQGGRSHHGRSSSQSSSASARRANRPSALSVSSNPQAARSAGDLGGRPHADSLPSERRRQSDHQHQVGLEGRQQFRDSLQGHSSSNPSSPRRPAFNFITTGSPSTSNPVLASPVASPPASAPASTPFQPPQARRTTDPTSVRQRQQPGHTSTPPMASPAAFPRAGTDPSTIELPASVAPTLYPEPRITCKRCGKEHIEHELHYNCSRCDGGDFNICLPCYRARKGCKHWFGFGWAAWPRYERDAPPGGYPPNHEHPHILIGRRYRRPLLPLAESLASPHEFISEDDPTSRLEAGVFCEICKAFANACYWKCDTCHEGSWGYCNDCVNQGRHCTHPILPVAHKTKEKAYTAPSGAPSSASAPSSPPIETSFRAAPLSPGLGPPPTEHSATTPPLTPKTASLIRGPGLITIANTIFRPLTFTTICNMCSYPIPPSHTRYHCQKCNNGDYDICMQCYHKMVVSGRISKEDGLNGWRRCLRGHRMIIVGFEDRDGGQRRVVVRDLVGGVSLRDTGEAPANTLGDSVDAPTSPNGPMRTPNWSWRDTDGSIQTYRTPSTSNSPVPSNQRFPPDGGVGLRVQAIWSYFPADGVQDELGFPKMAEIREAEDINGDWFWGVYCGKKGLFPGNYGRVIGGSGEGGRMI